MPDRRRFLLELAALTGGVVILPRFSVAAATYEETLNALMAVPLSAPADWDPVEFNRLRGNAGAIPLSYLEDINSPNGDTQHLGKHLPYIPAVDAALVPPGYVALMWGDPAQGYARHPNAPADPANDYEGHWYNWIRIRKATVDAAQEIESVYTDWPATNPADNGKYAVHGGGEMTADDGKNTIYLAALPDDAKAGDTIRIWAHCLTHGEYVDFITL